ncbi:hypothetical protein PCASD_15922 [Puccinia coronata f. sp. avenae]|uniref:Uncharacterized protein n=1 Tax=Puccinia coronata f. sp. avenae TaxID=200324 RepID=A0A2N5UEV1_9BASI|nr:hypothetical protein PCASD_15922 [Puccinia coronata f. sp. avenae]
MIKPVYLTYPFGLLLMWKQLGMLCTTGQAKALTNSMEPLQGRLSGTMAENQLAATQSKP